MSHNKKKKFGKKIKDKVLENIRSGFFTFDINLKTHKRANLYRVSCGRDCANCNLATQHSSGSDCNWHPDSDNCNIEFISKQRYPEFYI